MGTFVDITGQQFGCMTAEEYLGNKKWKCRCSCGYIHTYRKYELKKFLENNKRCWHNTLEGKQFGEWTVISRHYGSYYNCRCSCGNTKIISKYQLENGITKSCGHSTTGFKDLTGKQFGEWSILEYLGESKWKCKCSCGKIGNVLTQDLITYKSKSCGHNTNEFIDLTNKRFGSLVAVMYSKDKWLCKCDCGRYTYATSYDLRNSKHKSCGCMSSELTKLSKLKKYSEIDSHKFSNIREQWQIDILNSKEKLIDYIKSLNIRPTVKELAQRLCVMQSTIFKKIHDYNIEYAMNMYTYSMLENEIYSYIMSITDNNIIRNSRDIIKPKEVDIYIPEKKIALEVNGDYWHSDYEKDTHYHQNKTIECAKHGIRLIHIFEYEWINNNDKIKSFLHSNISSNTKSIFARTTEIREIESNRAKEFLDIYHLQNSINSPINLGLYNDNSLIAVASFGKSRFNRKYEYEIYRLAFKNSIRVIGGTQKLIKYFIRKYNPKSIFTYSDTTKFTGKSYIKSGFTVCEDAVTTPNYVWVNSEHNVLKRYETQPSKLNELGFDMEKNTEDTIMKGLGYMKIYDSGSLKMEYIIRS
jgi:possible homing endonuclease